MNTRPPRQAQWRFDVPTTPTGAFITGMSAEMTGDDACAGVVEMELRDASGKHLYDCHISITFSAADSRVVPVGGIVLAGDAGESFAIAGRQETGTQQLPADHPLVGQFATMLNDPRVTSRLMAFVRNTEPAG